MKTSIYCCLLLLSVSAVLLVGSEARTLSKKASNLEWGMFMKKFSKSYQSAAEELKRRKIWEENLAFIEEHTNSKLNASFQMKMNRFGDLTFEEFKKLITTVKLPSSSNTQTHTPSLETKIPDSVDWRPSGCVSQPIDEGRCGANWAFAVVGSIESLACLNNQNKLIALSVQQLVDCTLDMGNDGCDGGYFRTSYEYFVDNGVESNAAYPYIERQTDCTYDKSQVKVQIKSFVRIQSGSEDQLTNAVGSIGPVTAGVYVTNAFRFYSGGVFYDPNCESEQTDLGGIVVGYGTLGDNRDYYIFRNNWGSNWGDDGYIYMSRNRDNNCGIATDGYYPTFY